MFCVLKYSTIKSLKRKSSSWCVTALIRIIMMSWLVTSSQCASQWNKGKLCLVFLAALASGVGREDAQALMYPFGFQFNSASLFTYLNFPVWASVRRKKFDLFCWLYISITAWNGSSLSLHAGYPVIWLRTQNFWCYLKSIVFITSPCPACLHFLPILSLSISSALHPHVPALSRLHLYLSYHRTRKERASWTSFMPFRTCASACRMLWMKWPPMARG